MNASQEKALKIRHGTIKIRASLYIAPNSRLAAVTMNAGNQNSNPVFSNRMKLYCDNGSQFLCILNDGAVRGIPASESVPEDLALIEMRSGGAISEVKIWSVGSGCYLAMNEDGQLRSENDETCEETIFIENISGGYNNYKSKLYGFYLALNKRNRPKVGMKDLKGASVKFLPWR